MVSRILNTRVLHIARRTPGLKNEVPSSDFAADGQLGLAGFGHEPSPGVLRQKTLQCFSQPVPHLQRWQEIWYGRPRGLCAGVRVALGDGLESQSPEREKEQPWRGHRVL